MIPLCRYILQGGNQCQQAAINGEHYCRHHLVVRRTVAANTPKQNPYRIEKPLTLVFPEDRAALMIDVFVVMQAFNEGQISPRSANILTRLLHECGVILKQGPLYDTNHEHAVRRVVVTPEGEEIAPARAVPETGSRDQGAGLREEIEEERDQEPGAGDQKDSGKSAICEEDAAQSMPASDTSNGSFYVPPPSASDFACNDPCYIENLTRRREQYREFATYELAAGLDPRPWEEFIPGKSKVRKPKAMAG